MRTFLVLTIVLEGLALLVAGGFVLFGLEDHTAERPHVPVFRPPIHNAVIGDSVRYRRLDKHGKLLGYVDYKVSTALEYVGTAFGRDFRVHIIERDASGKQVRDRTLRVRPRDSEHGFLPPRFIEDSLLPGQRPIIASIRTAPVTVRRKTRQGFLIETVTPARSLEAVAERYWIHHSVAVFGVARWERGDEVLELHQQEQPGS
ncbi:MAG: hypothetical protein ACYTGN_13150 [Planctomycetota bacterium]|jgi:hypothetical protein